MSFYNEKRFRVLDRTPTSCCIKKLVQMLRGNYLDALFFPFGLSFFILFFYCFYFIITIIIFLLLLPFTLFISVVFHPPF